MTDLEVKLAAVNAEHAEIEEDLLRKKREVEPVEAKLQVPRSCFDLLVFDATTNCYVGRADELAAAHQRTRGGRIPA